MTRNCWGVVFGDTLKIQQQILLTPFFRRFCEVLSMWHQKLRQTFLKQTRSYLNLNRGSRVQCHPTHRLFYASTKIIPQIIMEIRISGTCSHTATVLEWSQPRLVLLFKRTWDN